MSQFFIKISLSYFFFINQFYSDVCRNMEEQNCRYFRYIVTVRKEQEILMVMRLRDVSSLVASFQQGAEEVWEEVLVLFQ